MESGGYACSCRSVGCVFCMFRCRCVGRWILVAIIAFVQEPALGFEFLKVVVEVTGWVDRVRGIRGGTRGPMFWIAVHGNGEEVDVSVWWDVVRLSVDLEGLRRRGWEGAFGDGGDRRDKAEFFGKDGAGHGAEEGVEVFFIVPVGDGAGTEDLVKGELETSLGRWVESKVEAGEVDAIGRRFVASEKEDEGVSHYFGVGECRFGGCFASRSRGCEGAFHQKAQKIHAFLTFAFGEIVALLLKELS